MARPVSYVQGMEYICRRKGGSCESGSHKNENRSQGRQFIQRSGGRG